MTAADDLEQLSRQVQYLMDRLAIKDCAVRHARGCDRYDSELLASAYHNNGVDEHGFAINPGPKYPEWVNAAHEERFQRIPTTSFSKSAKSMGTWRIARRMSSACSRTRRERRHDFSMGATLIDWNVGTESGGLRCGAHRSTVFSSEMPHC